MGPFTKTKRQIKDAKLNERDIELRKWPKLMTTSSLNGITGWLPAIKIQVIHRKKFYEIPFSEVENSKKGWQTGLKLLTG